MYVAPKRCPKCRYERQAQETAPDWQCPGCGVAYSKVEGGPAPAIQPVRPMPRAARGGGIKWALAALLAFGVYSALKPAGGGYGDGPAAGAAQPDVVMFATTWCGYCAAARRFFEANGIRYVELDVERDNEAARRNARLGGGGVPTILVGDDLIQGFDETRLARLLKPWMK